jgi:hypothetical protein
MEPRHLITELRRLRTAVQQLSDETYRGRVTLSSIEAVGHAIPGELAQDQRMRRIVERLMRVVGHSDAPGHFTLRTVGLDLQLALADIDALTEHLSA